MCASCGERERGAEPSTTAQQTIDHLFAPVSAQKEAVDVADTRCLKPGERVVVRGRILGAERLFEEGQAMFMMADPAYVTPDPDSPHAFRAADTPSNVKRAHMLTVQVLHENGHVLPQGLKGKNGLREMAYVVVSGVMDRETTPSSPVVDAYTIEVVDAWPLVAPKVVEKETFNPWGGGDGNSCPTCVPNPD